MKLALAPMVDITHPAFRELVAQLGGCDLFFTEMISIKALKSIPPERDPYLVPGDNDRPLVAQLAGSGSLEFGMAVERIEGLSWISGYNINLGCSKAHIVRCGWGSALVDQPHAVREIVRTIRGMTERPISVKLRSPSGHDMKRLMDLFEVFEKEGVDFVILHPRSPEDGFKRPARWEELKEVKKRFSVKVLGSGDVFSPQDALRMLEETGVDGVVFARGAAIRPWIIRDTRKFLESGVITEPPSLTELVYQFSEFLKRYLPEKWWERRFDTFLRWFLQNFDHALYFLKEIKKIKGFEEKVERTVELIGGERPRSYPVVPFLP